MSSADQTVHIAFHDTTGKSMRLSAQRSDIDEEVFKRFNPMKVFGVHPLMIALPDNLVVLPTTSICKIDISGPDLPHWPYVLGAETIEEVDIDDFRASYDPVLFAEARKVAWNKPGSLQIGYTEYVLMNGDHVVWQVSMKSLDVTPSDLTIYIQRLLNVEGLHARTKSGGITIINPKHIKRLAFHPGPTVKPVGALKARRDAAPAPAPKS